MSTAAAEGETPAASGGPAEHCANGERSRTTGGQPASGGTPVSTDARTASSPSTAPAPRGAPGFDEQAVVPAVRAPTGDVRDRTAVAAWADGIAAQLLRTAPEVTTSARDRSALPG